MPVVGCLQVKRLLGNGMSEEDLQEFALKEVEGRLTELLRQIPPEEVCKPNSFGREQAMSLCSEILAAAQSASAQALLEPVAESARILKGLLQTSDLASLAHALSEVEKSEQSPLEAHALSEVDKSEQPEGDGQEQAGIVAFLKLQKTGLALMADARKRLEAGKNQLEGELHVTHLQELLSDIKKQELPWGADGLQKILAPFWQARASGRDESKLAQKHRLSCDMIQREFFVILKDGVRFEIRNTLSGCLEILLDQCDAWEASREGGAEFPGQPGPEEEELDVQEILTAIRMKEFFLP